MRIMVIEERLGRFEWELPKTLQNDLEKTARKLAKQYPDFEANFARIIRGKMVPFLYAMLGGMTYLPATERIMGHIDQCLRNMLEGSDRILEAEMMLMPIPKAKIKNRKRK